MSRMFLFALGIVGVLTSASSSFADPAEDAAIKFVEKLGGSVHRDRKVKNGPVIGAVLGRTAITDKDIKGLAGLKSMTMLDVSESAKLTDAAMKQIAALKTITDLRMEKVAVTDDGLKDLAGLELASLNLNHTGITDAGVKNLVALKSLKKLQLANTRLTDAGLKELGALNGLTILDISITNVTADGVKAFKKAVPKCKVVGP